MAQDGKRKCKDSKIYPMKNYEIRFKTSKELFDLVKTLRGKIVPELVLSHFKERIFLLGINELKNQIASEDPNILIKLLKKK